MLDAVERQVGHRVEPFLMCSSFSSDPLAPDVLPLAAGDGLGCPCSDVKAPSGAAPAALGSQRTVAAAASSGTG